MDPLHATPEPLYMPSLPAVSVTLLLLLTGVPVPSLERLDHEPLPDRSRRDLDPPRTAVDQGCDRLQVRLELPLGVRGDLETDAALELGLAALADLPADDRSDPLEIAPARHDVVPCRTVF